MLGSQLTLNSIPARPGLAEMLSILTNMVNVELGRRAGFTTDGGSMYNAVVEAADARGIANMYMNDASRITNDKIAIFFALSFLSVLS